MKNVAYKELIEPKEKGSIIHLRNGKKILAFYLAEHRGYQILKDVNGNYWAYDAELKKVCEQSCQTFDEVMVLIDEEVENESLQAELPEREYARSFQEQEEEDLNRDASLDLMDELEVNYSSLIDDNDSYATDEEVYWALTGKF